MGDYVEFFQGEVNQTVADEKGLLTDAVHGKLVTRGANITMYQLRKASQGEAIYLDVPEFLKGKDTETKAYHHRYERVGLQESSPQNNFRRIISCRVPEGHFCNHKINYTFSLNLVLFVLNSRFTDWYFRLGSTNAAVSHYQLSNIPCPAFGRRSGDPDLRIAAGIEAMLDDGRFMDLKKKAVSIAKVQGCTRTTELIAARIVQAIEAAELNRGEISRNQRSELADNAEKFQVILDKIILVLLGIGEEKHQYISQRLHEML